MLVIEHLSPVDGSDGSLDNLDSSSILISMVCVSKGQLAWDVSW